MFGALDGHRQGDNRVDVGARGWLVDPPAAAGEDRPLPYAASMPVRAGITDDKGTASKTIRALAQCGVVEHVGSLPPLRPGIDGTKLYAPPAVENVVELRDRRAA